MNIPLGTSTATIITGYVSGFISDFAPVITLLLGVILALFIVDKLINIFRGEKNLRSDSDTI